MKRIINFSLIFGSLLGLLKIFSIFPFVRMAADDYSYVNIARSQGFWMAQKIWYESWTGRFSSTFFQILYSLVCGHTGKTILYSALTISVLFVSFWLIFKRLLGTNFRDFRLYVLASISLVTLYILTPNKMESWYWMTGSVTYLWPIIFLLLAFFFASGKRRLAVSYSVASVLTFLSVGFNETFGLLVVVVLLGLFTFFLVQKKINRAILLMLISAVTSFLIVFLAPGNKFRSQGSASDTMNPIGALLYSIQSGPGFLFTMIVDNIYLILPLLATVTFVFSEGGGIKNKRSPEFLPVKIYTFLATPVLLSIVYMFPAFRILGRVQPDRSGISLAFIVIISIVATAYCVAETIRFYKVERPLAYKVIFSLSGFILFICSFSFVSTLAGDFYTARNYSKSYDAMIVSFKNLADRGNKEKIIVVLPPSGLVAPTLDAPGKSDYKNQALSEYYGVGIIITKPE
jgi:hypothetical protein